MKFLYDIQRLLNNLSPRSKLGDVVVNLQERVKSLEARVAALEAAQ